MRCLKIWTSIPSTGESVNPRVPQVLTGVASRAPAGQDTVIPRLIELLPGPLGARRVMHSMYWDVIMELTVGVSIKISICDPLCIWNMEMFTTKIRRYKYISNGTVIFQ